MRDRAMTIVARALTTAWGDAAHAQTPVDPGVRSELTIPAGGSPRQRSAWIKVAVKPGDKLRFEVQSAGERVPTRILIFEPGPKPNLSKIFEKGPNLYKPQLDWTMTKAFPEKTLFAVIQGKNSGKVNVLVTVAK